jgi:hypothetical protein
MVQTEMLRLQPVKEVLAPMAEAPPKADCRNFRCSVD